MNYNITTFPVQKLPLSKKTEEWRKRCVDYIIGTASISRNGEYRTKSEEMQTYYDLYNGIYNEKDLKYVTNPYKQEDGFPATAKNFNIIRSKIDLLLGEETKRPFDIKLVRTSNIAVSQVQEELKQKLTDYLQSAIMANLSEEDRLKYQQALQSGEIQTPEQIQKYYTYDYKDLHELTAYHILKYLYKKLNLDNEFNKAWKDGLIGGEEIGYVGILNGEPYGEIVNPLYFDYETSEGLEFIHDASWCVRKFRMSYSEVYDRLYDKLSEKDLNKILEMVDGVQSSGYGVDKSIKDDYNSVKFSYGNSMSDAWSKSNALSVMVYHTCWRSFKKIGFITIENPETGEPELYEVDETYKVTGRELDVEWEWIIEIWEGYRIGDDLYVGMNPIEYQHISTDNPNSQKLPYTGVIYSNTNSKPKSLVSVMKPLQYMYIILWYRLELALARDKGKVPVIDITQIPKSMGIDVAKWMHYMSALGVAFVNPYEDGWDIPGREGGKPSQFNQFTALDLTMANVIDQYIGLMAKIEDMLSEISGITRQRQGAISSNELVGNVERSVVQSANITEPLYWKHNQFKKEFLTMLLDTAKVAYANSGKKKLNYILDDATRAFLDITPESLCEDFDLFLSDSSKDKQVLEYMKQLIQPAMQNGASLLDASEVLTIDNVTLLKKKLEEIEQKRMQQEQEMQEQQAQQQQQIVQMQNEVREEELMLEEAKLDIEKYKIDTDNATKIAVAQLGAYKGSENMDQDMNGIPDPIEIGKQALERQKVASEAMNKQIERSDKRRETESKQKIENRKLEVEREKMQHAEKLQKLKDDAAMERERLKAKTVLKNKVSGE